ncbi:cAMP-dependent protein kinase catalytic subunit 1 isoform X1 [Aethina tumida]|uniref:cAMP-dependent protein kinase catalytic subunit 1 isoform X1 n=1 Tax=Aethina tumida TaxID=116153 RepID=UPI002148EB1C|nr:cAMP-dependent protein kinase catalytic subunit 1 isoform X1 [Aethina tumida]
MSKKREEEYEAVLNKLRKQFEERFNNNKESSSEGLDNYEKFRTLGTGSFGRVLLVKDKTKNTYHAMKVLSKQQLIRTKQVEHTLYEKKMLMSLHFPFIISMDACFKDNGYIYFVMPFINGGEMFTHLRKLGKFDENLGKFYAAQVVLGLEYLHHCKVIYRDLKPENILIDSKGYIKIADLGFCKIINGRTWTLCGTPEYIAPEIILSKGYGFAVDWWSFGVLCFEMCAGYPPFTSSDPMKIYERIIACKYRHASNFSLELRDLITNLLQTDLSRRYGNLKDGVGDIKHHRWFDSINYSKLFMRKIKPPFEPHVKGPEDASQFDKCGEDNLPQSTYVLYEDEFAEF